MEKLLRALGAAIAAVVTVTLALLALGAVILSLGVILVVGLVRTLFGRPRAAAQPLATWHVVGGRPVAREGDGLVPTDVIEGEVVDEDGNTVAPRRPGDPRG